MSTATSTLKALITADPTNFISGINLSIGKLLDFSDKIDTVSSMVSHFADGFVKEIAAVTAAIGVTTYQAENFDDKMRNVYTLVDETTVSLGKLGDETLRVANALKDTPADTATALYQVISAGVDDMNEALQVTEQSGKLAKGGLSSTIESVDLLTTAMNAYGKSADDVTVISDQFMTTVKEGKTTIAELAASFGRVAPLAYQAGLGMDELNAATAALTKNGIATAEAHTYIRAILTQLIKPSSEASKLAEKLGIDFSIQALRSKGLAGFLKDLEEKTGGNVEIMGQLFNRVEALNGVLALSGEKLNEYNKILGNVQNSLGATETAFKKQIQPLTTLFTNIKNFSLEIGTRVLPVLNALVSPLNKLFELWQGLNPLIKDTIIYIGILAAVLAPFRYILMFLGVFGGHLIGLVPKLLAGIAWLLPWLIRAVPWLLKLLGLTNPIVWVVMAIIGVIQALRHNLFGLTDAIKEAWKIITDALSQIINEIYPVGDAVDQVKNVIANAWKDIKIILKAISEVIREEIIKSVEKLRDAVKVATFIIIGLIKMIKQAINDFVSSFKLSSQQISMLWYLAFGPVPFIIGQVVKHLDKVIKKIAESREELWKIIQLFRYVPMIGGMVNAFESLDKIIKKYDELKESWDEQTEKQKQVASNQADINKQLDGTASRLQKNSKYWHNWAKEIMEGLRNKSKYLAEVTAQQPNYGLPLTGGVSSAKPSDFFKQQTPMMYHFEINGENYYLPGPEDATTHEKQQAERIAQQIRARQKNRSKSPTLRGGY
jgi:TP901 family phage tail tape measure protein